MRPLANPLAGYYNKAIKGRVGEDMKYMTIKEAALRWAVSERLVQQYCTSGRVAGAEKFGGAWAIPADASKPEDPRKEASSRKRSLKQGKKPGIEPIAMPLLNTDYRPGYCMDAIVKIPDQDSRNIALSEFYYFSGQAEKASDIAEQYLHSENIALRLSACWIYAYSNLALDRIDRTRATMAHVQEVLAKVDESSPERLRALALCVSTGARVLLHLPLSEDLPKLKDYLHLLHPGLKLFALYVQAHQTYLQKAYGTSIGIVETALALEGETYPIPSIYLHLVATMDYMSLRQPEEARRHLLAAWELAKPDDLIEPFAEHHGLLGGMLEAAIKKDFPEDFRRIINITYKFSAGWRKIHNPDTGHWVADNLSTTEFAAAMLAARDWSNKEIAAHMGISEYTVKNHIALALQKLGITQRKELKRFMLN